LQHASPVSIQTTTTLSLDSGPNDNQQLQNSNTVAPHMASCQQIPSHQPASYVNHSLNPNNAYCIVPMDCTTRSIMSADAITPTNFLREPLPESKQCTLQHANGLHHK
jgi:hypothetical protein